MVRTKAPLASLGASGQIGKTMIASSWKGRSYMKKLTIPTNPNTPAQVGVRIMHAHLLWIWNINSQAVKDEWLPPARAQKISPQNAYVQNALTRWSTGLFPSRRWPIDVRWDPWPHLGVSAPAKGRGLNLEYATLGSGTPSTLIIYASQSSGFTPSHTNAIHLEYVNSAKAYEWLWTPLTAGTYYFRVQTFSARGNPSTPSSESSGVVS